MIDPASEAVTHPIGLIIAVILLIAEFVGIYFLRKWDADLLRDRLPKPPGTERK